MNNKTISSEKPTIRTKKNLPRRRVDIGDGSGQPLATALRSASASTRATNATARELEAEVVRFCTKDRSIDFNVDLTRETVWASLQQIADLFGVDQSVISLHIQNIFDSNELVDDTSTHAKIASVQLEGSREVARQISQYSLDVILSVGYRVDSKAATDFRKWANTILRSYLTEGFVLNEKRLRSDPLAAESLSARLRAIRSEEKHNFAKVRDYFKLASTDYDGSAKSCKTFYALLQDKFHFAASGLTACQLVLSRANHRTQNMGMTTFSGTNVPTMEDAKVGKNYLSEDELRILHIVSEQFLLYVDSRAIRGKAMTMSELAGKFDELLKVNGYEVFAGYGRDFQRPKADRHAMAEYARFMVRQRRIVPH